MQYSLDQNGYLPVPLNYNNNNVTNYGYSSWPSCLKGAGYIQSTHGTNRCYDAQNQTIEAWKMGSPFLACPSSKGNASTSNPLGGSSDTSAGKYCGDYGINGYAASSTFSAFIQNISKVASPSNRIMAADASSIFFSDASAYSSSSKEIISQRHAGKANFVTLDGSVHSLKFKNINKIRFGLSREE